MFGVFFVIYIKYMSTWDNPNFLKHAKAKLSH